MFYIDDKALKKGNKWPILLIVIGLLFVVAFCGVFFFELFKKNSMDGEVIAHVDPNGYVDDEGSYVYSPVYYYEVNGKEYTCRSSISSSKTPGTTGTVYYSTKDPSDCITDYAGSVSWFLLIGGALGALFLVVGVIMLRKNLNVVKKAKYLSKHGKLIKGIPYRMVDTNTIINNRRVQRIEINYTLPSGSTIILVGNPRYDFKTFDDDGLVDLLIDPNDPNNYFIDFEINYTGNVQVETYSVPNQQVYNNNQVVEQQVTQFANTVNQTAQNIQAVQNGINAVSNMMSGTISSNQISDIQAMQNAVNNQQQYNQVPPVQNSYVNQQVNQSQPVQNNNVNQQQDLNSQFYQSAPVPNPNSQTNNNNQ